MRSRKGSAAMAGVELHPTPQPRHPELVSASIVPPIPVLEGQTESAFCSLNPWARAERWTLKQVQGDDAIEVGV